MADRECDGKTFEVIDPTPFVAGVPTILDVNLDSPCVCGKSLREHETMKWYMTIRERKPV